MGMVTNQVFFMANQQTRMILVIFFKTKQFKWLESGMHFPHKENVLDL